MGNLKKIFSGKWSISILILLIIGVNFLATVWHTRFDFTDEKRFTLSNHTIQLLSQIQEPVNITVLLEGDLKSEFKKLSNSTKELLQNFKNYGGNNIQFTFEMPGEGLDDSAKAIVFDSLVNLGLRPTTQKVQIKEGEATSQRQIFPGAVINYRDRTIAIDFLQGQIQKSVFNSSEIIDRETLNSAEALLEYKFANAIQKITMESVPVVAYAYGNGEPPYGFYPVNDVFQSLGTNYIVDTFNLKSNTIIDEKSISTLVIVKPTLPFTDEDKFKLDQFVMHGGKLLFFVDVLYAERDSLQNGELVAYSRDLNLNDLLFRYGARINTDLISDKHCDKIPIEVGNIGDQSQKQLLPWPYSPLLQSGSDHPIVKNQGDILAQFANSIDTIAVPGITKSILLSTSVNSNSIPTPTIVSLNSLEIEEDIKKYNKKNIPVGVLLEGKFKSLFANRASAEQMDWMKQNQSEFLSNATNSGKIIVVADADVVINQVSESIGPLPMGTNKYTKIGYANRDFFLNCTEYLANENNMLEARAKDYTLRLLDLKKIEEEKTFWQMMNIVFPILLIVLFAIIFQWLRKRKFSK